VRPTRAGSLPRHSRPSQEGGRVGVAEVEGRAVLGGTTRAGGPTTSTGRSGPATQDPGDGRAGRVRAPRPLRAGSRELPARGRGAARAHLSGRRDRPGVPRVEPEPAEEHSRVGGPPSRRR
jgi:hypothetical protein